MDEYVEPTAEQLKQLLALKREQLTQEQLLQLERFLESRRERPAPRYLVILWGALLLYACFYTAIHRSLGQILEHSTSIATVAWAIFVVAGVLNVASEKPRPSFLKGAGLLLGLVAVSGIVAILVGLSGYALAVLVREAYLWTFTDLQGQPSQSLVRIPLAGGTLCLIAALAYQVRRYWRAAYGALEVLFGAFVGGQLLKPLLQPAAGSVAEPITITLAIGVVTSSVYLIVQGYESLVEGIGQNTDPLSRAVRWLRRSWTIAPID
jgi:hypothetical protein